MPFSAHAVPPARPHRQPGAPHPSTSHASTATHTRPAALWTPRFSRALRFDVVGEVSAPTGEHTLLPARAAVPGDHLLRTRVYDERSTREAPEMVVGVRLCQHFERHGVCSRGHKCRFAHHAGRHGGQAIAPSRPVRMQTRSEPCIGNTRVFARGAASVSAARLPITVLTADAREQHNVPKQSVWAHTSHAATVSAHFRDGRMVVVTPNGWRHAAYAASALS